MKKLTYGIDGSDGKTAFSDTDEDPSAYSLIPPHTEPYKYGEVYRSNLMCNPSAQYEVGSNYTVCLDGVWSNNLACKKKVAIVKKDTMPDYWSWLLKDYPEDITKISDSEYLVAQNKKYNLRCPNKDGDFPAIHSVAEAEMDGPSFENHDWIEFWNALHIKSFTVDNYDGDVEFQFYRHDKSTDTLVESPSTSVSTLESFADGEARNDRAYSIWTDGKGPGHAVKVHYVNAYRIPHCLPNREFNTYAHDDCRFSFYNNKRGHAVHVASMYGARCRLAWKEQQSDHWIVNP